MSNVNYHENLFNEISEKLSNIKSVQPFQLLFYGSKFRGDDSEHSDYNFYLIASPTDQLQSNFIHEVSDSLEIIDTHSSVGLIAGDFDSLKYRLKIFEPTAVHLCEYSEIVFGKYYIEQLRKSWARSKSMIVDTAKLVSYLENRSKFYRNLRPKTTKEDIARIEKVISLNIQMWIFGNIHDISATEICFMDIPYRLISMVKILYKDQLDDNVNMLTDIYKDIHELKQSIRMSAPYSEENLARIKDTVQSIQSLSNTIVKKI